MIRQKTICAKIDPSLIEQIRIECYVKNIKLNRAINQSLTPWLETQEACDRLEATDNADERTKIMSTYLDKYLRSKPEELRKLMEEKH